MKKYAALIFAAVTIMKAVSVCASAADGDREFENNSVIAVVKMSGGISLFSTDPFAELGISETENLDAAPEGISLLSAPSPEMTLKLTLENPGRENVLKTVEKLNDMPQIKHASPNYIHELCDYPDDPYFVSGAQYELEKINASSVWDMNVDCSEVTIAVIDSGALLTHPDLSANIWTNPGEIPDDGEDNDHNGYKDDVHGWDFAENDNDPTDEIGHGTHVSGIAGAVTNNGTGIASISRNVKIVPLKTFFSNGKTNDEYVYKAIKYVRAMGFDIVNNSYGSGAMGSSVREAIEECENAVFVCAAGNEKKNNDETPTYPASFDSPNVISVAYSDENDDIGGLSNYGTDTVDIAAPGTNITSAYIGTNEYYRLSGTSMAVPLVSGTAAVIKAAHPDITAAEIIEIIKNTADSVPQLKDKVWNGARLNAYSALTYLEEESKSSMPVEVSYDRDEKKLTLTSDKAEISSAEVIQAVYDGGRLTAIKRAEKVSFSDGIAEINDIDIEADEKIFVWNDLSDSEHAAEPLAEVFAV